jgi:isopenicillin N synthase-like dioxygenase
MTETVGSSSPIPIVDFGKFLLGNSKERKEAASEIDEAFRTVGFVYLKNHGVKKQRVDECFEWV